MPERLTIIPEMSGYTTALNAASWTILGTASASSETAAPYLAWFAFNNFYEFSNLLPIASGALPGWLTDSTGLGTPQWLQYQFPAPVLIDTYSIVPWSVSDWPLRAITDWHLDGSNDGSSWTTLDTQTGMSLVQYRRAYFPCVSGVAYSYYRLVITGNGGDAKVGLSSLELFAPDAPVGNQSVSSDAAVVAVGATTGEQRVRSDAAVVAVGATTGEHRVRSDAAQVAVGASTGEQRVRSVGLYVATSLPASATRVDQLIGQADIIAPMSTLNQLLGQADIIAPMSTANQLLGQADIIRPSSTVNQLLGQADITKPSSTVNQVLGQVLVMYGTSPPVSSPAGQDFIQGEVLRFPLLVGSRFMPRRGQL